MGRASKVKGARGELEVCGLVEAWWRQLEPECVFRRTPGSGGLRGPQGRHDAALFCAAGDLMTTAKRFPFTIEVKRREAWSLDVLLRGRRSPVWAWWSQCCRDAEAQCLKPMLWFRKNNGVWRVAVPWYADLSGTASDLVTPMTGEEKPRTMAIVLAGELLKIHPTNIAT